MLKSNRLLYTPSLPGRVLQPTPSHKLILVLHRSLPGDSGRTSECSPDGKCFLSQDLLTLKVLVYYFQKY